MIYIHKILLSIILRGSLILSIFLFLSSPLCYAEPSQKSSDPKAFYYSKTINKNSFSRKKTLPKTDNNSDEKEEEPPSIGNFALPASQQPGSYIAFGELIFDKGTVQLNMNEAYFKGIGRHAADTTPNLIYCPSDTSSIFISVPYALQFKESEFRSHGLEDITIQWEQAISTKSNLCYLETTSIVLNGSFPSGSVFKDPATGYGAPTFLFGVAYLRSYVDWLFFTSQGIFITTSHEGTKFGNTYLYQFGTGRNIAYKKDRWIFDLILELSGQYSVKNKNNGSIDPNSGGNIILLTPSIWFSTKHIILQFGISKPIVQQLFGIQSKTQYILLGNFAWTF